jgi:Ca2+-binding EF-hand superfamily protein
MNRAERRRRGIKGKEPIINLKSSNISKIKADATTQAVDTAFIMMLSIPLMVLRDKYGFGKKRLEKFSDYALELYDSFDKGYVSLDDLIEVLKEEVGVEVKFGKSHN